jgi:hypothetical protein
MKIRLLVLASALTVLLAETAAQPVKPPGSAPTTSFPTHCSSETGCKAMKLIIDYFCTINPEHEYQNLALLRYAAVPDSMRLSL